MVPVIASAILGFTYSDWSEIAIHSTINSFDHSTNVYTDIDGDKRWACNKSAICIVHLISRTDPEMQHARNRWDQNLLECFCQKYLYVAKFVHLKGCGSVKNNEFI